MARIIVNGSVESNSYYRNMLDKYLASERFKDRCHDLRKTIERVEKEEAEKRKEKERLKKAETLNMF